MHKLQHLLQERIQQRRVAPTEAWHLQLAKRAQERRQERLGRPLGRVSVYSRQRAASECLLPRRQRLGAQVEVTQAPCACNPKGAVGPIRPAE
jgi:hypothetical protein